MFSTMVSYSRYFSLISGVTDTAALSQTLRQTRVCRRNDQA